MIPASRPPWRARSRRWIIGRAIKFCMVGGLSTLTAYLGFIGFLGLGASYLIAATLSCVPSVICGFLLNRRFTFGIKGPEGRRRDLALFVAGAGIQYVVSIIGYVVLIGSLKLPPTPAFMANLCVTTASSFAFHNLVTFRRAARR